MSATAEATFFWYGCVVGGGVCGSNILSIEGESGGSFDSLFHNLYSEISW